RESLLEKKRVNEFTFVSLYQGEPRPKGGTVFNEPTYYNPKDLPKEGFRVGYGVDFAYTEKTRADWSVCLQGRLTTEKIKQPDGTFTKVSKLYLTQMDRAQVDAPAFTLTLKSRHAKQPGPMRWYVSGTEQGAAQFVRQKVPSLQVKTASSDKLIRATPVSEAWNDGRVLIPYYDRDVDGDAPEWVEELESEVKGFTGIKDAHDDIVDALAALWDLLNTARIDLNEWVA